MQTEVLNCGTQSQQGFQAVSKSTWTKLGLLGISDRH